MLDFLDQHSLYVVLIITLIVWVGIYGYLIRMESRVRKLEQSVHKKM